MRPSAIDRIAIILDEQSALASAPHGGDPDSMSLDQAFG